MNEQQRKVIRTLKGLETNGFSTGFDMEIPVLDDQNLKVGSLKPVDCRLANDEEIVSSLSDWRVRFKRYFFTQFEVTNERTKTWLNNVVIQDDTRILFLIMDATGKVVGHVGARNITLESAELDNVIRGERGGGPKLILLSAINLIGWIYRTLNIKKLNSRVLAANFRVLSVIGAIGCFEDNGPPGLVKDVIDSENVDDPEAGNDEVSVGEVSYIKMTLNMQKFLYRYPWMGQAQMSEGGIK